MNTRGIAQRPPLLRPFLRWAGGKQKLVRSLLPFVPSRNSFNTYYEPFFGGGSLFFAVRPKRAVLSDINADLINCYRQVAKDPESVADLLRLYARRDSSEFFYRVRAQSAADMSSARQAARFIYLNKAAFNGIYRVNRQGCFNVPYGPSFNGPSLPSREALIAASRCLRKATLLSGDFEDILDRAAAGDFVYLDPPYPPLSRTAYFTHYSMERFNWDDQTRVAQVFSDLTDRGCFVMLSNSAQRQVAQLYREFRTFRLSVLRWLGSNGDRFRVGEIVVINYNPLEVRKS